MGVNLPGADRDHDVAQLVMFPDHVELGQGGASVLVRPVVSGNIRSESVKILTELPVLHSGWRWRPVYEHVVNHVSHGHLPAGILHHHHLGDCLLSGFSSLNH